MCATTPAGVGEAPPLDAFAGLIGPAIRLQPNTPMGFADVGVDINSLEHHADTAMAVATDLTIFIYRKLTTLTTPVELGNEGDFDRRTRRAVDNVRDPVLVGVDFFVRSVKPEVFSERIPYCRSPKSSLTTPLQGQHGLADKGLSFLTV